MKNENKRVFTGQGRLSTLLKKEICDADPHWLLDHQCVRVNGCVEKFGSYRVQLKDRIEVLLVPKPSSTFEEGRILFEDEWLLAYHKPPFISSEQLVQQKRGALLVHRLDRDTTGVMLFAKKREMQQALEELFYKREVEKSYLALVSPIPKGKEGEMVHQMGKIQEREGCAKWGVVKRGLKAEASWKLVELRGGKALLRLFPRTGRTHQLRVQLSAMGMPIVGDVLYGNRRTEEVRPQLHAESIQFTHPMTNQLLRIECPWQTL